MFNIGSDYIKGPDDFPLLPLRLSFTINNTITFSHNNNLVRLFTVVICVVSGGETSTPCIRSDIKPTLSLIDSPLTSSTTQTGPLTHRPFSASQQLYQSLRHGSGPDSGTYK